MLNTARHTSQEPLLDAGSDEVVLYQEFLKAFRNNREEDLAHCVGDSNWAKFGRVVEHVLGLLKEHNKGNGPISRDVLVTENLEENLVDNAEDGIAFFVDQVGKTVQPGACTVAFGVCMPPHFFEVRRFFKKRGVSTSRVSVQFVYIR